MTRQYQIPKRAIVTAWEAVRRAGGGAGHDGKTIADVGRNLKDELYKVWNRMSSGSYMAQPVKLIQIPKLGGGQRTLGIPTVTDRIAQAVVKMKFEPLVENIFHKDSYAYRPNRSAIDAVGKAKERCFCKRWVLDIDIKGFFDTLDHTLIMGMVEKYTKDKMIHLYIKRFIKAKGLNSDGSEIEREMGTPQGGVLSPV
jgi:group II intron reverse transcriptase/maturase